MLCYAVLMLVLLVSSGLPAPAAAAQPAATRAPAGAVDNDENQPVITQAELLQMTMGFADRYMTYIVSATEKIDRDNPNVEQRRLANRVRLVQVSALYDIATNADPFTQLIDMTLVR